MKRSYLLALGCIVGLCAWTPWLRSGGIGPDEGKPLQVPEATVVRADYVDLAIACVTLGSLTTSAYGHGPELIESIVDPIARVLEMHMEADFDSYIQACRSDLVWANHQRSRDVAALKAILATDLGVPMEASPNQWVDCLRLYWKLMYAEPVLVELDPPCQRG
jgi:hypothetical protein